MSRGESYAGIGVLGLTVAIGSAIWQQTSMSWPFSPAAWFVAGTAIVSIVLIGCAYISMRSVERLAVPLQRESDEPGWRWSSSPTSAANTASAAKIGFRVTVVESVERRSPTLTTLPPAKAESAARRYGTSTPRATEPDAWTQHLSAGGNVDIGGEWADDLDQPADVTPIQAVVADPTERSERSESVGSAAKAAQRRMKAAPIAVAPVGAKRPARGERAGAPPVQRRARRDALATAAASVSTPEKSADAAEAGDGLDDLAQRLMRGVARPRRRLVDSAAPVSSDEKVGPRRILRDDPGVFACPEATRD